MKRRYQQRAGGPVPGGIGAAAGAVLAALCWLAGALPASARDAGSPPGAADLAATIAALDAAVFDAFNRCAEPGQLEAHAAYFDPAVEFYHDTGGATWTREAMLENTRRHACGRFTRALVPGGLAVHPVPGFGAIARGGHRFCQADTGRCDGEADFVMLWRHRDGAWQVTRVLSYGHRPAANR